MTSIITAGSASRAPLAPPVSSRIAAASIQPDAVAPQAGAGAASPSIRLTLAGLATNDVVYQRPQAAGAPLPVPTRAWALPMKDDISALMARNSNSVNHNRLGGSLADQWRGLGGALLSRFATTASDYRQALADYFPPEATDKAAEAVAALDGAEPLDAAAGTAVLVDTPALDAEALAGVKDEAVTVKLAIETQSGQTIELKLAVNPGGDGKPRGIQLESTSSGPLSNAERKALAQLAEGFDQVLEGLGKKDELKLDVAKLMNYDSSVLAGLDLTVNNPKERQPLTSLSLQINANQKKVAFTGAAGEMALNLDTALPLGAGRASQRRAAIDEHLRSFDAAGKRGHADAQLLALFKSAFTQLHATPVEDEDGQDARLEAEAKAKAASKAERRAEPTTEPAAEPKASILGSALQRQVQPLQSGLADFQASFSGDTQRLNDRGAVREIGRAHYQFSQRTTLERRGGDGDLSITQTRNEKLEAHYDRSLFGGMLDTRAGHYEHHAVRDESTSTTSVDTARHSVARAVSQTDLHQLQTYEKLMNHRPEEQRRTPLDQRTVQRLR
jgi:hypothetical protein